MTGCMTKCTVTSMTGFMTWFTRHRELSRRSRKTESIEGFNTFCPHIPNKGEPRISAGFVIMAITVTSPVEDGKRKTRMG